VLDALFCGVSSQQRQPARGRGGADARGRQAEEIAAGEAIADCGLRIEEALMAFALVEADWRLLLAGLSIRNPQSAIRNGVNGC
jgi:hypothetical protein